MRYHHARSPHRMLVPAVAAAAAVLLSATIGPAGEKPGDEFARWEEAIAAFERQDREKRPPKNALLFVGSSSIRKWDLPKYFPERDVINRGFGGSEIADSIHFADRIILKHEPRVVVLYAGDNDIARGKSPQRVAADFQRFVKTVRAALPETKILFIAIKPSIARWKLAGQMRKANSLIRRHAKEVKRVEFVDIWKPMLGDDGKPSPDLFVDDGLHLNDRGYKLWTSILRPRLK